jgi:hypothetical protein
MTDAGNLVLDFFRAWFALYWSLAFLGRWIAWVIVTGSGRDGNRKDLGSGCRWIICSAS